MHFSIPDTKDLLTKSTASSYTGYTIYINGSYHCCLRYKQLHALHEQLRRRCAELHVQLPVFPPKRLLPLTSGQLETRRSALEHYLQEIGQDVRVTKLEYFQKFFLNAQIETAADESENEISQETTLEVVLMNGYQLQVNCHIKENATALLRQLSLHMKLPMKFLSYFCLYLMRNNSKEPFVLLRRLMDFESPFLSQRRLKPCQVLLRTSYCNPKYDLYLMQDVAALHLLYIQTLSDVEHEWIIATPELRRKLRSLQEHGMKKEYLELARLLPLYGSLQFAAAAVDYPEPQTSALISIGNRELSLRTAKGKKVYETKFRVTRMRCWRIIAMHSCSSESKNDASNLQLSFEYLMSKQSLRWITITSEQAMLMSVCLQAMVDELINCKDDKELVDATNTPEKSSMHVNSTNNVDILNSSALTTTSSTPSYIYDDQQTSYSTPSPTSSPVAPVKFLVQRRTTPNSKICSKSYSAAFFRKTQKYVQNEAFEGIGDEDL